LEAKIEETPPELDDDVFKRMTKFLGLTKKKVRITKQGNIFG